MKPHVGPEIQSAPFLLLATICLPCLLTGAVNGGAMEMSAAQHSDVGRDLLGDEELEAPGDPSFESVSRHYPAMKGPREALGVKDGPQEIGVLPDASLVFGDTTARFVVSGLPAGPAATDCSKRLLDGFLPIVVAEWESGGLKCEQTAIACSPEMSPDTPLTGMVRLKVVNSGPQPCTARIQFDVGHPVTAWSLELQPGAGQSVHVKVPFAQPSSAAKIETAEFDKQLEEVSAFWKTELNRGMKIHVPEQRVNDAYRAWLAWNFINVDKRGSVYEPHDGGAGFYEEVYGYSASRYCTMLDLYGYHEEAQRYLDSILSFVQSDGLLLVNYGLPDTGVQLWAMGRHYQLTGDGEWLRKVAPTMRKMCDFVIRTRAESMSKQTKEAPWYGLIKYRPYCDEPTPAYSYHTDTYLLLGMEETAAALRGIGMTVEADRLAAEAAAYRTDILASMDKAVIERDGMMMLPIFPETQALLKRVEYTGRDYYSLVGSCVLETDVIPADDHRARWITDLLERRGGLSLGACAFRWPARPGVGIDHAYTYGYWMNCLRRNDVKRVILGLYTSLAYGMTRGTYAGVEYTNMAIGENDVTLPHLYSGTQQLLLLRNMLLCEEGDALVIGKAIPRPWLADGKEVRVDGAQTFFGKLSFSIKSHDSAAKITMTVNPPAKRPPRAIVVHLRRPGQDKAIQSVKVNGTPSKDFTRDTLTLADLKAPATVEVQY